MSDVRRVEILEVVFVKETPEVATSPRGWSEGAVVHVDARVDGPDHVLLEIWEETFRVSREVLVALLGLLDE